MADVTAADVKKLRDLTGAGMMECKKALQENDGDFEKAAEALRVKGAAKAAARGAEREASNGLVVTKAAEIKADSTEALAAAELDGKTVAETIGDLAGVIGEKLELGRVAYLPGTVATYMHRRSADLPAQVGVLVAYEGSEDAARSAAMQIAAMRASYLTRDEVPADIVETERRVAEAKAKEEGKPEAAMPKIVEGRVNAFFKDNVLLEQESVVESKKSVKDVLDAQGTTISRFVRFEIGA